MMISWFDYSNPNKHSQRASKSERLDKYGGAAFAIHITLNLCCFSRNNSRCVPARFLVSNQEGNPPSLPFQIKQIKSSEKLSFNSFNSWHNSIVCLFAFSLDSIPELRCQQVIYDTPTPTKHPYPNKGENTITHTRPERENFQSFKVSEIQL